MALTSSKIKLTDELFLVEESTNRDLQKMMDRGPEPGNELRENTIIVDSDGVVLDGRLRWQVAEKWQIPILAQEVDKNPYFVRIAANSTRRSAEANALTYRTLFDMAGVTNWVKEGEKILMRDFGYSENMARRIINMIRLKESGSTEKPPDYLIGNEYKPTLNFVDNVNKKELQTLMKEIKKYSEANDLALGEALLFVVKNGMFAVRGWK